MAGPLSAFLPWIEAWDLVPEGEPFETDTRSRLLRVSRRAKPCMLKVATDVEEIRGASLMAWWAGAGVARVVAHDGPALLLERAAEAPSLAAMSRQGQDREATEILCGTIAELHRPRGARPPAGLPNLKTWFQALASQSMVDRRLAEGSAIAQDLLRTSEGETVLHGDIHHANVLYFGEAGWRAIDPKGLIGERAYDYANIFRNPDQESALVSGRLEERLDQVSRLADLDPQRLLRWATAHSALSAAWSIEDGCSPAWSFAVLGALLEKLDRTAGLFA